MITVAHTCSALLIAIDYINMVCEIGPLSLNQVTVLKCVLSKLSSNDVTYTTITVVTGSFSIAN